MTTNILITGTKGFIASHLTSLLSENSENRIFGLHRSSKYDTFDALGLHHRKNISLILGDIKNYHTLVEIIADNNIDQIYHLAAQPIVQKASKSPVGTYETNIFGTIKLLEAVRTLRDSSGQIISVLVMSSDKSYGPADKLPYTEDHPLGISGTDIYSSSKACADIISRAYAYNYDMDIVIARPANTYGEFDFNATRLIPTLIKAYYKDENNIILNRGSYYNTREYNYVMDTVHGLETLMRFLIQRGRKQAISGKAFNLSSGCVHTTEEVVNKFIELTGYKKPIEFKEKVSTFKEIKDQYLDSTNIKKFTGWKPEFDLETGLKRTIDGYGRFYKGQGKSCTQ